MDKHKSIKLKCGVCGSTEFEYDDLIFSSIEDADQLKCSVCNKIYKQDELLEANSKHINNTVGDMGKEMLEKELKRLGLKFK